MACVGSIGLVAVSFGFLPPARVVGFGFCIGLLNSMYGGGVRVTPSLALCSALISATSSGV